MKVATCVTCVFTVFSAVSVVSGTVIIHVWLRNLWFNSQWGAMWAGILYRLAFQRVSRCWPTQPPHIITRSQAALGDFADTGLGIGRYKP